MPDHEHRQRAGLRFFASTLVPDALVPPAGHHGPSTSVASEVENVAEVDIHLRLDNATDSDMRDMPAFQRHEEASNHELFFDLCKSKTSPHSIWQLLTMFSIDSLRCEPHNVHLAKGDQRFGKSPSLRWFLLSCRPLGTVSRYTIFVSAPIRSLSASPKACTSESWSALR
jgi:hypothetical protein